MTSTSRASQRSTATAGWKVGDRGADSARRPVGFGANGWQDAIMQRTLVAVFAHPDDDAYSISVALPVEEWEMGEETT